ncbi:MAG: EutN/CcmL family microcompartment protein [Kiritimatiellales bacterium]|nr:EutN/CcmL family microcompartment protein [Kiritimatiellales bacterium]
MIIAKVIGNVVSTIKHIDYEGKKLFIVQPVDPAGNAVGKSLMAVDAVQSGIGDTVLVLDEGGSARMCIDQPGIEAIRCFIAGIVDEVQKEI